MQELNLLDDAGFARRRAAELLRKRKSRRAILDDLHAKGIDRGAAAEAVEALFAQSEEDEEENPELAMPVHWWNATMPQSWHRANGSR